MKENKVLIIVAAIVIVGLLVLSFLIDSGSTKTTTVKESELSNDPQTILANAQQESESVKENEKKDFKEIRVADYLEYRDGLKPTLILVARPTCGYCQIAEPILQKISYEYNLEINYLNTDEFTEEEEANFLQSDEFFTNSFGTPLLLVVNNSTITDKVDGLTDYAHYVSFLQKNGMIQ